MLCTNKSATEIIFGEGSLDESSRQVSDMLWTYVNKPSVEIEAKVGQLISKTTYKRLFNEPRITSECIIQRSSANYNNDLEFSSTVSAVTFESLSKFLDGRYLKLKEEREKGSYLGPILEYERVKEEDEFYKVYKDRKNNWVRVSVDPVTKERKRAIRKDKLYDLNFYCPHRAYDFRISVSDEVVVSLPGDEHVPKRVREKDRISYKFDNTWQIDITVVHTYQCDTAGTVYKDPNVNPTYEIEIELDANQVLNVRKQAEEYIEAKKNGQQNPWDNFTQLSKDLLQQVRTLVSCCAVQPQVQQAQQQQQQDTSNRQTGRGQKRTRIE